MDTSVESLSSTETLAQSSACFTQDLSAVFWEDSAHSTIQSVLSSLRQLNADRAAARAEIPDHPFERLKYEYSHPESQLMSFDDISVPEDFCPIKATEKLNEISDKFSNRFDAHLAALSGIDINEHPHFGNAFAEHSEGRFVLDRKAASDHLMFTDMIKQVPVEYIKANPEEFARKVITKYIEVYQ